MIRVADYVMERLCAEGVNHIFMVTGRGVLYLSDAVARADGLHGVSVHHEQAAACAALAYAQYNEKIGACLVSTGCASTNAITGLLSAWQDNVPCVFISGQNMLHETTRFTGIELRTFGQQEADIISVVKPLTKYAEMLTKANNIAYELDKAIFFAQDGRPGPVWLDIPLDLQNMRVEESELRRYEPASVPKMHPMPQQIDDVCIALETAQRPVILLGSGIRSAGAVPTLYQFLDKHPFPVVFDSAAADIYGLENTNSIGVIGNPGGTRAGNFTVQNSDLILCIGCRLSPMTTGPEYQKFAREAKLIVVDVDAVEHSKNTVRIDQLILSDALLFLQILAERKLKVATDDWLDKCRHWKQIFPKCEEKYRQTEKVDLYALADALSGLIDDDAVVLSDAGIEELIIPATIAFKKAQRCIHSSSQGAMGFALPASIGAYFASHKQVVVVVGDGSIMMNLQELQTIRFNNVPVKIIIANNNCYSVIRKRQKELFRSRTIGTDHDNGVSCPEFKKIAYAFDIPYSQIDTTSDLTSGLLAFLEKDGPQVCEVMCVGDQEYICNGYARTKEKRFVQRPIEDQTPFMERDIFSAEMIVDPIDQ